MIVARSIDELRSARQGRDSVALVPTMGALHAGHRALLSAARAAAATVVMSLFVNPTQFTAGEDLAAYPRDEARDLQVAAEHGCEIVFAPTVNEMYPAGFATVIDPGPIARPLDGLFRPGHFEAVATVVTKLITIVRPASAWFGAKDWQQLLVVRRVALDLDLGVAIRHVETVREPDGLALSSRNAYLSDPDRVRAVSLSAGLRAATAAHAAGERDPAVLIERARAELLVTPEYLELRERDGLADYDPDRPAVMAVAAHVGRARLIDNIHLVPEEQA